MEKKEKLYQFCPEWKIPIYIKCDGDNSVQLSQCGFVESKEAKDSKLPKEAYLLEQKDISLSINSKMTSDVGRFTYGPEIIYPIGDDRQKKKFVYRYSKQILIEGLEGDFSHTTIYIKKETSEEIFKLAINRYLSWALLDHKIIGFWGFPIDNGLLVTKQKQSKGLAQFINLETAGLEFYFYRIDATASNGPLLMTPEELYCFLVHHCTYYFYKDPMHKVRELLELFTRQFNGYRLSLSPGLAKDLAHKFNLQETSW